MGTAANRTIVVVLALGVAVSAQTSHPAGHIGSGKTVRRSHTADDSLPRAETAIDKKDYATAEQLLLESVKSDERNFRAWYDLGFVYTATQRKPEAIEAYRKAVAAKPDVFESNLNLGLMLAQAGDASAEKYLRAATALKPAVRPNESLAQAWMALGMLLRQSNPRAALDAYAKAAQLRPSDAQPHLEAAQIAENAKDSATAEKEYRAAAQLEPKSAAAAAGLANVYMETGRLEDAEHALRNFLAIAGDGPPATIASAHLQLGHVLLQLHRRNEALAEMEEATKLAPADDNVARELAWLYLQDKQYDKAEASFRQMLAKEPKNADLHHGLGSALIQEKKFPEAQQELLLAVRLKPELADAYSDLAFAASENKNYGLTVQALDARAKFLKESPGTLFLRATALDHLGDRVNAANSYRDFLAVADGRYPDQEWQARHRLIAIDPKKK